MCLRRILFFRVEILIFFVILFRTVYNHAKQQKPGDETMPLHKSDIVLSFTKDLYRFGFIEFSCIFSDKQVP